MVEKQNKLKMVFADLLTYFIFPNLGTVHAQSTRLFELDDHLLPYAWNHSITYNRVDNKMPYLVQRLYARGMEVEINPTKEIVLLQLDASIGPGRVNNIPAFAAMHGPRSLVRIGPGCAGRA